MKRHIKAFHLPSLRAERIRAYRYRSSLQDGVIHIHIVKIGDLPPDAPVGAALPEQPKNPYCSDYDWTAGVVFDDEIIEKHKNCGPECPVQRSMQPSAPVAALPGPEPKPGRYYSDYEDAKWDTCLRCGHFRAVDQQFCADCLDKFGPPCDHCGLLFVEGGYRSQSGVTNFCDACLNILDTADRPGGAA